MLRADAVKARSRGAVGAQHRGLDRGEHSATIDVVMADDDAPQLTTRWPCKRQDLGKAEGSEECLQVNGPAFTYVDAD